MTDLSRLSCTCPECGKELWKERDGEMTLQQRILKVRDGKIVAVCYRCKHPVLVDFLTINPPPPRSRRRAVVRLDALTER